MWNKALSGIFICNVVSLELLDNAILQAHLLRIAQLDLLRRFVYTLRQTHLYTPCRGPISLIHHRNEIPSSSRMVDWALLTMWEMISLWEEEDGEKRWK